MAYRKRNYGNKRRSRRRTYTRRGKRSYKMSLRKPFQSNTHFFKRSVDIASLTYTSTNYQITFALNDLANSTEFTSLFDRYKLLGAKITFVPQFNSGVQGSGNIVRIRCHVDRDGGGPHTAAEMQEMPHRDLWLDRPRSIYVKAPCIQSELYRGVATTAYSPKTAWIDCAYNDVPHYSLNYSLCDTPISGWTCKVIGTYYLAMKGVR